MNDREILGSIDQMVKEEHELLKAGEHGGLTPEQEARLNTIKVHLDQCWDLLRQRRARREFGMNPDEATERDASTVERYKA
ncbi:MAG: DUF2630 family protein [Ktedonobacterales bacterium]